MSTRVDIWKPPTIAELIAMGDEGNNSTNLANLAAMDVFNVAINQEPPARWIKKHPIINVKIGEHQGQALMAPLEYIPIETHRLLGKRFFGWVGEEILREGVMFQSVYVAVRLHYKHPITGEKLFHDGIGACDAQTKKGASAADLANINPGAIQKGLPAAATYALNNAYKKFGKLFGQDLQKGAQQFNEGVAMYGTKDYFNNPTIEDVRELYELKKEGLSSDEIRDIERIINNNETKAFKNAVKLMQSK